jgi:hypothetical protein
MLAPLAGLQECLFVPNVVKNHRRNFSIAGGKTNSGRFSIEALHESVFPVTLAKLNSRSDESR